MKQKNGVNRCQRHRKKYNQKDKEKENKEANNCKNSKTVTLFKLISCFIQIKKRILI